MLILIKIIYLLLPAAVANMTAALSSKLFPNWTYPVDGYKKLNGQRILGDHKTVRGFVIGTISATLVFLLQKHFYSAFLLLKDMSYIDYTAAPLFLGTLIGFGALAGDAIKSFFKRQYQINPGKSWFPFDQIDWVLGTLIATAGFISYTYSTILGTLGVFLVLHIITKFIGYRLKLDKEPF